MASKNAMIGMGAALAGLSGLALAAVSVNTSEQADAAKPAAQTVETRTVVVRTVEHRVKRLKPRHHRKRPAAQAAVAPAAPAPVVRAAPVPVAATPVTTTAPAPIRTRTSGSSGRGGDDGAEHEVETRHQSGDDSAEHADD